jgi:hypothetical protein
LQNKKLQRCFAKKKLAKKCQAASSHPQGPEQKIAEVQFFDVSGIF